MTWLYLLGACFVAFVCGGIGAWVYDSLRSIRDPYPELDDHQLVQARVEAAQKTRDETRYGETVFVARARKRVRRIDRVIRQRGIR